MFQHVLFSVSVAKLSKINDDDTDKDFDNDRDQTTFSQRPVVVK